MFSCELISLLWKPRQRRSNTSLYLSVSRLPWLVGGFTVLLLAYGSYSTQQLDHGKKRLCNLFGGAASESSSLCTNRRTSICYEQRNGH